MTSDLFKRINNAVLDLQQSELQTYEHPLRRLGLLLQDDRLREINDQLIDGLDLQEFFGKSSNRSGMGNARLPWPDDARKTLGLQLLLLQWLGNNPDKAIGFSHDYFSTGPKIIAGIHSMTRQLVIPFVRDYKDFVEASSRPEHSPGQPAIANSASKKIFIVHGHDDGARESVARFVEKLGLRPVILREQANRGRTIIEKVEANAEVGFAIVLLTPDDEGRVRGGSNMEGRARQNVLLELGYFLARLGRDRVCTLMKGNVEMPSDFAGVVWESMDQNGGWKLALARELREVGYAVDLNLAM